MELGAGLQEVQSVALGLLEGVALELEVLAAVVKVMAAVEVMAVVKVMAAVEVVAVVGVAARVTEGAAAVKEAVGVKVSIERQLAVGGVGLREATLREA